MEDNLIEYEYKEFCGKSIRQRLSDGYLNATDMCKINGRFYGHYIDTNTTKEFINELSCDINIPISQLIEVRKGNSKKFKQGTWVHPHVAIHLAQWLSPKFSVAVSKWVLRFMYGDLTLIDEIKQNNKIMQEQLKQKDKELIESKNKITKLETKQLKLESFVHNIRKLDKNQFFYIATTQNYARQNRFEYGGVKYAKDLKCRLATYNTGRAEGDLYYYAKLFKCNNYKLIEERIGSILQQFKDKVNSRKEMIHLRYNLFAEIADFICDNYDREIEYINLKCQEYLNNTIELNGIIPDPIDLQDYIEITVNKNGVIKHNKIDITGWDDEKIDNLIAQIINLCANEKKQMQYDIFEHKHSVALELTWGLLTPYLDLYNGLSKTDWRNKFKEWYNKTQPKKIQIKGIKLK